MNTKSALILLELDKDFDKDELTKAYGRFTLNHNYATGGDPVKIKSGKLAYDLLLRQVNKVNTLNKPEIKNSLTSSKLNNDIKEKLDDFVHLKSKALQKMHFKATQKALDNMFNVHDTVDHHMISTYEEISFSDKLLLEIKNNAVNNILIYGSITLICVVVFLAITSGDPTATREFLYDHLGNQNSSAKQKYFAFILALPFIKFVLATVDYFSPYTKFCKLNLEDKIDIKNKYLMKNVRFSKINGFLIYVCAGLAGMAFIIFAFDRLGL